MNDAEFDELYAASFSRLTGQVYAMCGDRAEAADCVQEAFIRAWSHRGELSRSGSPEAWVRTVATRLAVSRWRKFGRQRYELPADVVGEQGPDVENMALQSALQQLPVKQRQAVVLHHLVDLSVSDVAREMGAPEGSVKVWLKRGRTQLAKILDNPSMNVEYSHA